MQQFQQNSRIGNDMCDLSQRSLQNGAAVSYMVDSVQPTTSGLNFGLDNQLQVKTSHSVDGLSAGLITKPKAKISLMERQFLTVPYLGKGRYHVDVETQLRTNQWEPNRKSANPSSETSYMEHHHTPMIDSLKESISNPAYLVEESAHKDWRRGGQSSRDIKTT